MISVLTTREGERERGRESMLTSPRRQVADNLPLSRNPPRKPTNKQTNKKTNKPGSQNTSLSKHHDHDPTNVLGLGFGVFLSFEPLEL
jgi:hypothetical protein